MNAQELTVKAGQIKNQVRALTTERQGLAPLAVNGDARGPEARKRIKVIDRVRASLMGELETIEDALRSPEYREASAAELLVKQLNATFAKQLDRHKGMLRGQLKDEYETLLSGSNAAERWFDRADLEKLPLTFARGLTGETYARKQVEEIDQVNRNTAGDPAYRHANRTRYEEEWRTKLEVYSRHTQELLAATTLPQIPGRLLEKIDG